MILVRPRRCLEYTTRRGRATWLWLPWWGATCWNYRKYNWKAKVKDRIASIWTRQTSKDCRFLWPHKSARLQCLCTHQPLLGETLFKAWFSRKTSSVGKKAKVAFKSYEKDNESLGTVKAYLLPLSWRKALRHQPCLFSYILFLW